MLGEVDDDSNPTTGTSTCMSALALAEELLIVRDDPEQVSLPTSLFIILQKPTKQQNSWNGLENKSQRLAIQELVIRELIIQGLVV